MTLAAADSARSGSFSRTSWLDRLQSSVDASRTRPSGHASSRSSTAGSVTSMGFAVSPTANATSTAA